MRLALHAGPARLRRAFQAQTPPIAGRQAEVPMELKLGV